MKTKLHLLSTLLLLSSPAARSAVTFTFDYSDPSAADVPAVARAALDVAGANMAAFLVNYNANVVIAIEAYSDPDDYSLAYVTPAIGASSPGFGNRTAVAALIQSNGATDPTGAAPDGIITINIGDWWDYSTGSVGDPTRYHFVSSAMHELGHHLGFVNSTFAADGSSALVALGLSSDPTAFLPMDRFMVNGSGQPVITPFLTVDHAVWDAASVGGPGTVPATPNSGLYYNGPNGMAANGGQMIPFWSPAVFEQGSTNEHLGSYFQGAMMFPYADFGEVQLNLHPVEIGIFKDLGYALIVPEPGSALLVLCGLGLVLRRRRAP